MVKRKSLKVLLILSILLLAFTSVVRATETVDEGEDQDTPLLVSEGPSDELVSTLDETLDETLIAPSEDGTIDVIYEEDTEAVSTMPEIIEHDVFVTEGDYVLAENEHINGNVYIMANKVTISGYIEGNVFILAQNVSINSPCRIEKTLYIAASNIDFNGGYLFDIYATANKINFTTNAYSIRDVKFAANTINLAGYFGRNLDLTANTINPDLQDLKVQNNFTYSAPQEIKNVQANVEGDVKYTPTEQAGQKNVLVEKITSLLGVLVFSLIVACVLIFIFKGFTNKSAKAIKESPVKAFLYGLLVLVCVPILAILLFVSLYGACIGGALLFCLAAVLSISSIIVSVALARKLKGEDKKTTLLFSMLFVLAIWVLKLIPVVGGIVKLLTWIFAPGIVVLALLDKEEEVKESKKPAKKVEYGKEELEEIKAEEKAKKEAKKEVKAEKKPVDKKTTTKKK